MKSPVLIGITGGTGSGKTTVVKKILEGLDVEGRVGILHQDAYYKTFPGLSFEERKKINYDHPFAFDNELFLKHIKALLNQETIEQPVYSFQTYSRLPQTQKVGPSDIVILEGLLLLDDPRIRDLLDIKVYVDADADIRFIRRLQRDINERSRTPQEVIEQYLNIVRPMHLQFVEPTKRYADIIIPKGGHNQVAIDILIAKIKSVLEAK